MAKMSKEYRLKPLLTQLYKLQKEIMLCYRPTTKNSWGDRALYLSEGYSPYKEYNHRSVLDCEVIIEYDYEDLKRNKKYIDIIAQRLSEDGISWSKYFSGNKSTHLHIYIDVKKASNLSLLKNAFVRIYSKDLPLPDMRLIGKHLIRAEYGVHEKTGKRKTLISRSKPLLEVSVIPEKVWTRYTDMMERVVKWKTTMQVKDLSDSEEVKVILDTVKFREFRDGRERALFMLIHLLKHKYETKGELTKYLQEWYRYSSGTKLSDGEIKSKVNYHFNRDYNIGPMYIATFLEELGHTKYGKPL